MAEKLISAQVQQREISFKPGGPPAELTVTVINYSDRFASFQLEIMAAGIESQENTSWYSLSPEVSTKKPPGAATEFRIAIADTPAPGFIGMMNLTVRVFSVDLEGEDRQIIRLNVEQGNSSIPLVLELPVSQFQGLPDSHLEIPVRVMNPSQLSVNAVIRCLGLETNWFPDGIERRLQIAPGKQAQTSFPCQLPPTTETLSQVYPFKIEATHAKGAPAFREGSIEVLPAGYVEFNCDPKQLQIPPPGFWWQSLWWQNWRLGKKQQTTGDPGAVIYGAEFENASNLPQQVSIEMVGAVQPNCNLELIPEQENLAPGERKFLELRASKSRHWFGWVEKLILEVGAVVSDKRVDIRNDVQVLELRVMPIVPRWLQGSGLFLLFLLMIWVFTLEPQGHKSAVNVVQFSGLGDWVVSGSNDQTIRTWNVEKNHLHPQGVFAKFDKSVRTIRYRPRDNNTIAVGLENGEIQLWDLLSSKGNKDQPRTAIATFSYQKADRVLALEFSADSRYLFSGHGSGLVFQWDTDSRQIDQTTQVPPVNRFNAGFAVYALELVGRDRQLVAIAGQYNGLVLWNTADNSRQELPYPIGGSQEDYIFSIDSAEFKPNLLATADQQGYITLWDLNRCLGTPENCQPSDRWSSGHREQPVQSVALSADGCHLVSGGADGKIMLWPLTKDGRRADPEGYRVQDLKNKDIINSIDVKRVGDYILVVGGSRDAQVRFQRLKQKTIDKKVAPGCGS